MTAVVALYGPHDLTKRARAQGKVNENLQKYLALPEALSDEAIAKMDLASPIKYVKKDMPPFLLIHGTKDPQVPYELSVDMCAKMTAAGVSCELFTVPDGGHGMGGWEKVPEMRKYKEKMVEWLQLKLKK